MWDTGPSLRITDGRSLPDSPEIKHGTYSAREGNENAMPVGALSSKADRSSLLSYLDTGLLWKPEWAGLNDSSSCKALPNDQTQAALFCFTLLKPGKFKSLIYVVSSIKTMTCVTLGIWRKTRKVNSRVIKLGFRKRDFSISREMVWIPKVYPGEETVQGRYLTEMLIKELQHAGTNHSLGKKILSRPTWLWRKFLNEDRHKMWV